ncbi:hypothetical protein Hanom_Chr09g00794571 [Helianthus anomalus]
MYYWWLFTCIFHFRLHRLTSNHLHLKNLAKFSPARRSNSWKLGLNPSMAEFNNVKSLEEVQSSSSLMIIYFHSISFSSMRSHFVNFWFPFDVLMRSFIVIFFVP